MANDLYREVLWRLQHGIYDKFLKEHMDIVTIVLMRATLLVAEGTEKAKREIRSGKKGDNVRPPINMN